MNVAYHLKRLGQEPALITRIGNDDWGGKLVSLFRSNDLSTEFFQTDPHLSTGLVYAYPNEQHEVSYDIVKPAAWDAIQWEETFPELISKASVFVFGSLSSRSAASRETLLRLLQTKAIKVFDINLRPPHFERSQIEILFQQTNILKLNEHELELVSSWYGVGNSVREHVRILEQKYSFQTIIVTLGAKGADISSGGKIREHPGYPVKVADTIGSGDAFLAGFIHHLIKRSSIEEAIAFSCAMGAFIATRQGGCPEYGTEQVLQLMQSGKAESLSGN